MLEKNFERAVFLSQEMKARLGSETSLNPASESESEPSRGWSKSFASSDAFTIHELIDDKTGANEFGTSDNTFFELRSILAQMAQTIEEVSEEKKLVRFIIQELF